MGAGGLSKLTKVTQIDEGGVVICDTFDSAAAHEGVATHINQCAGAEKVRKKLQLSQKNTDAATEGWVGSRSRRPL